MMDKAGKLTGGLYLVADAAMEEAVLYEKIGKALDAGISAVQFFNVVKEGPGMAKKIDALCDAAHRYGVPVLVTDEWALLEQTGIDGVHFEAIPDDYEGILERTGRNFIRGITCSNDLSVIGWADRQNFDYISFCSMFPTASAPSCEIVSPEVVVRAREMTGLPIFLAGGIVPENTGQLQGLPFDGLAVISGIMAAEDVTIATQRYLTAMRKSMKA